ncbi:putative Inositol 2-dehydrogenase [Candidatus Nitrosocaldus cavascurensis]|uniref:Putative Inositol 2-dehydrogenase n=1 Tax=Candidatus Nitrosocaldus cavascurensis TaxID=2058097 RepID=A0A2K5AR15_9ARCH|nr:putative Inositol 2-dehydrogenase [Candidatus Nitrosocaldus cavascurensis]
MRTLRLCVVGAEGGVDYARALSRFDALTCIYDMDVNKAKEFASMYGISYYTSLEEMIASKPDGLVIATPADTHLSIIASVIEQCKNIFLVRPVGGSFRECREIVAMAKKSKAMLVPGYIERFNPLLNKTREVVDSRRYGRILLLEIQSGMMKSKRFNSSLLYDVALDDIDAALYMLNAYPDTVFAVGSMEKAIAITLGFRDGRVACITSNNIKRFRRITITMENGMVRCDLVRQEIDVDGDSGSNYVIKMEEREEPISSAMRNFIDAIEGRDKPKVSVNDALLIEKVADSALLSSRIGSQIYIHIQQDDVVNSSSNSSSGSG